MQEAFVATNSQRMESLSFVAPIAYTLDWLMFFSDKSKLPDDRHRLGARRRRRLGGGTRSRRAAFAGKAFAMPRTRRTTSAARALMGIGGVTALGCTIGQGLSGLSTLALASFIALAAIIGGAVAALHYQVWRSKRRRDA